MTVAGQIKRGAYFDSVTLMRVGRELGGCPGVADAAVIMGTKANKAILDSSGLLISRFEAAGDADLLIAVKANTARAAEAAVAAAEGLLKGAVREAVSGGIEANPGSLDAAIKRLPGANLALISLAGRYAGAVAMRALERGLHVMLFSDNVPLDQEIRLKKFAREGGLLVMGPDCGTAIINGVPLGFANVVRRGDIGVVGAAGTGMQEVCCLISNAGSGISQAIGTGGRDVKQEVGGIMFLAALRALARDTRTRVILLVSKPPHPTVLDRIRQAAKKIRKPVVALFVGADPEGGEPANLEEAALQAMALAQGRKPQGVAELLAAREAGWERLAAREAARRQPGQKYVRGLFSGGTFCAEAQVLLGDMLAGVYSNVPIKGARQLRNALVSRRHTLIDLGEDEFTVGRLHPMMDYSLRNSRILKESADTETAVILLDLVLGFGSNPDPAAELSGVIRKAARRNAVVCSIIGTEQDPQNRVQVEATLRRADSLRIASSKAPDHLESSPLSAVVIVYWY